MKFNLLQNLTVSFVACLLHFYVQTRSIGIGVSSPPRAEESEFWRGSQSKRSMCESRIYSTCYFHPFDFYLPPAPPPAGSSFPPIRDWPLSESAPFFYPLSKCTRSVSLNYSRRPFRVTLHRRCIKINEI